MKSLSKNIFWAITTFLVVSFIFSLFYAEQKTPVVLSIDQLVSKINSGEISKIAVNGNNLTITLKDNSSATSKKEIEVGMTETLKNYGVDSEALQKINFEIQDESGWKFWASILLPSILPLLIIGFFFWFTFRQAKTGMSQAFTFGKANIKLFAHFKDKITFNNVAGLKEAKEELLEVVDFLKNPKKYLEIGARIPRGVLLLGSPGTGKCITGESLVLTNKGPVPIADIPKYFSVEDSRVEGAQVLSLNQDTQKFEWQKPSHWFDLGLSKTIKIKTQLGTRIEGTPEHPLIVLNQQNGKLEFKKLEEIKEKDLVLISYNNQSFGIYKKIPCEEIAYFMGLLTGDGGLTVRGRIIFTSADEELVIKFKDIVKKIWQYEPSLKGKYDYHIFSLEVKNDVVKYGLNEVYSENKTVPESILLAPKNIVAAYLRGLFDTDGYCDKKNGVVEFSSASRDLIFSVHQILMNFGVINRIYEKRKLYNNKLQYYISVGGDFLKPFHDEIGFGLSRKRDLLDITLKKNRNTNNNLIYGQKQSFKDLWLTLKAGGFSADREFYRNSFYKNVFRYIRGERNPSVSSTVKILDFAKSVNQSIINLPAFNQLEKLSQSKHFFTPVVEIKNGIANVYDFTVPCNHSFVANGFVNHNTLLAQAVAGEAQVPFFHISASEFVEMFVGVGAARTRDAFDTAKKAAPSILFIDEIDAIGRERGAGVGGGGHDEREQTLNQILVEMDGFDRETKVIVIAATNRPDILDPALLRPGRFDRRIILDMPGINDREEILAIHARGKILTKDINLRRVAERTPGFSGAELANLMNEAAIWAARKNQKEIKQQDVFDSIEKVLLGPERRSRIISSKEKEITAYHEAGHALIATSLKNADPVHKISIISRGRAGGYTLKIPIEDENLRTKNQFMTDLTILLGGYVSEKATFGDISTGASSDLQSASEIARKLITKFGMSEKLGPITYGKIEEMGFLGRGISIEKNYSEKIAAEIDGEVKNFMNKALISAQKIISSRKHVLRAIADKLMEKETLEREEFDNLIKSFKLKQISV